MKIRQGFVSNSSSASFVLDKRYMTTEQASETIAFTGDGWEITEDENFIRGFTVMDNGDIEDFFKKIELSYTAIVYYEGDSY